LIKPPRESAEEELRRLPVGSGLVHDNLEFVGYDAIGQSTEVTPQVKPRESLVRKPLEQQFGNHNR
jgi:hypothetical protein